MKVEITEQGFVKVGDTVFTSYNKFSTTKALSRCVLTHQQRVELERKTKDVVTRSSIQDEKQRAALYKKTYNKLLCEVFQCSAPVFKKLVNALMYKAFVAKYNNMHVKKLCLNFHKKSIDSNSVDKLKYSHKLLDELLSDGIYNIAPVVHATGKSPQQLRNDLGKSVWKKIANNSFSKNKLLFSSYSVDELIEENEIADMPSTLLHYFKGNKCGWSGEFSRWATTNLKGRWSNKRSIRSYHNIYVDTKRMCDRLGKVFNPKWGEQRLKQEHDKYTAEINALRYSKDKYGWLQDTNIPSTFEFEDYSVVLLDNSFDIHQEGVAMGHCVGSYAEASARAQYLVYSVRDKDGMRYSTIGLHWDNETKRARFNQHYKKFNNQVDDPLAQAIPQFIIEKINN